MTDMTITTERKKTLISEYGCKRRRYGSPEVQVAVLSERITNLTEHFKTHVKDNHSRRGHQDGVAARRLLDYIKATDEKRYEHLSPARPSALSRIALRASGRVSGRRLSAHWSAARGRGIRRIRRLLECAAGSPRSDIDVFDQHRRSTRSRMGVNAQRRPVAIRSAGKKELKNV